MGEGVIELVNPVLVSKEGVVEGLEGCLSIPEKYGIVERPRTVTVRAFDRKGNEREITVSDFCARAVCHEMDHLDGRLFIDLAKRLLDPEELEETQEERRKQ